jgi:hypothetical protein
MYFCNPATFPQISHQNLGIYLIVGRVFISSLIISPGGPLLPAIVPQMLSLRDYP